MRRQGGFAKANMTKAANRLAFTMWLAGCTDEALSRADTVSLARSYGLDPQDVASRIRQQQISRRMAS